jgi:hypothetical protein
MLRFPYVENGTVATSSYEGIRSYEILGEGFRSYEIPS